MPKKKSVKNKDKSGSTSITLNGGKPGAFFYLYHPDQRAPIATGSFTEDKIEFEVSSEYTGKATLKANIPERDRRGGTPTAIMKEVDLSSGPLTINLQSETKRQNKSGQTTGSTDEKKLLDNELQEKVQEKKAEAKKAAETGEKQQVKKKFLFNKLGELVRAKEEEVASATK